MTFKNKSVAALFLAASITVFAQQEQDSLYKNIEVVKITKLTTKGQNKQNLETKQSDNLNHDAGKFLSSLPEINGIRKAGNYATDPVLRGFKYEQLNIVIDGAAAAINACPSRMDPAVSQVNLNTVQEAEIYKGPYHFRNGNSFGGTINFITIPPIFTDKTKLGGRISTGYETNGNVIRNEALTQVSSKKIVWDLFGSYQKGDRYKDGNGNEVRSAFLRYNIGTKGNYKWNENNITTLQINTNQGRDVEFAALNMDLIYDKTWMYQLKHLAKFNHKYLKQIDFNSYVTDVKHSMGTPDRKMVSDVKSFTYGARTEAKFAWSKNTFYTGFDYKHEGAENIRMTMPAMMPMRDGTSWQNSHINQIGWFNEYQYAFSNSKLVFSLRLDYNEADAKDLSNLFKTLYGDGKSSDFNHNVSLGYNQNLTKNSQIGIWAGRAQRSGSLTERFINRFVVGIDAYELVGNPDIKPETNNQVDLIYTYKRDNVFFQADVFYSHLQDYITGVVVPIKPYSMSSPGTRQIQNIDKAYKTGIETRFNWQFLPKYRTELAAAYTYAEDIKTNNPLPEIAPLDFRWNLEADFSPVTLGINYRFSGKQDRINPNFGELKTKDFSVFDFNARYNVFKNANFTFNVLNIFDRAYSEHLSRAYSTDKTLRILSPGRSFSAGFSYTF